MTNNAPYQVLVADDELPSRTFLCELIKEDPRFKIAAACDSGESTVAKAHELPIDAMFLDIQMPGMDGFEVVQAIKEAKPLVVFVTAHGHYAVKAFEFEATDYVKKPIDPARFQQTLDRVSKQLETAKRTQARSTPSDMAGTLAADSSNSLRVEKKILHAVRQDLIYQESEVCFVESAGNYVNVQVKDQAYPVRDSLDNFCKQLSSVDFVRVHRSYVVNVNWVKTMSYGKSGSAELKLADGQVIPVSRGRRKEVTEILRRLIGPSDFQGDEYVI